MENVRESRHELRLERLFGDDHRHGIQRCLTEKGIEIVDCYTYIPLFNLHLTSLACLDLSKRGYKTASANGAAGEDCFHYRLGDEKQSRGSARGSDCRDKCVPIEVTAESDQSKEPEDRWAAPPVSTVGSK